MKRIIFVILTSLVGTILIFLLLTYTGLALKFMNVLMPVFGLDPQEEGSGEKYTLYFILGFIGVIFILLYIIATSFFFKKRK